MLAAQRSAAIPTAFQAEECPADPADPSGPTRLYTGVDGVMVPIVTDVEKVKRRTAIKQKRQRSGKKCRPLPPRRKGSDKKFKEFKVVTFYDETGAHWHEVLTRGRWDTVGPLLRREARRLNFAAADEKIANVDGATRIRNQLEAEPHELPLSWRAEHRLSLLTAADERDSGAARPREQAQDAWWLPFQRSPYSLR